MNQPATAASATQDFEFDFGELSERPQVEEPQEQYASAADRLASYHGMANIADVIDKTELNRICQLCKDGYDMDKRSSAEWLEQYRQAIDLSKMIVTRKDTPWENASNVKHPLIAQSAIQFNSRAMPNIIPEMGGVVKCRVIGADPDGQKAARAQRISEHMSFQLTQEMTDWATDMDRALITLPIVGTVFKKTYHDPVDNRHVSEIVYAQDLIINNDVKSFDRVQRISEKFWLYPNEAEERMRSGAWSRVQLIPDVPGKEEAEGRTESAEPDEDRQMMFIEQHRLLDLDDDGYKEPYIVTWHYDTQQIVRIVARYDMDGVETNGNGEIIRIRPVNYYTIYTFIPDPDGKLLGMGFGILFNSTARTINTAINQLLDAGFDQNAGGGFISDKMRSAAGVKGKGYIQFQPGRYYTIQKGSGDSLQNEIYPRPTSQPSAVLFKLLGFMVEYSERTMSSTDVLTGKQTLANVPATTTMALIEQGLKVFSAIYKRIHSSLAQEFKKIKRLNKLYLDENAYYTILDEQAAIAREDYNDIDLNVVPVSDPNNVNDAQVLLKAEALLQLVGMGYNDNEIRKRYLEALRISDIDKLLEGGEQQPDSKVELEKQKLDLEERRLELDIVNSEIEAHKTLAMAEKAKADALKSIAQAESEEPGEQLQQYENDLKSATDTIGRMQKIIENQFSIIQKNKQQAEENANVKPESTKSG